MSVIRCEKLTKSYLENKQSNLVLQELSFEIEQSEFVMITGPSGSGKSTLLYLLSGLEKPSSGTVWLFGKDLANLSHKDMAHLRQREIGFVFQSYNLLPTLNVYDNIAMPYLIKNERPDQKRIQTLLELTGLRDKAKSFPDQLSGGMQQRVAIARSLVHQPKIVFADEPTGNLDKEKGDAIMELFQKINQDLKTTIVLVTHNLNHSQYVTRVIELANAKIEKDTKVK